MFSGVQCDVNLEESGGGLLPPVGSIKLFYSTSGLSFTEYWMNWVHESPTSGFSFTEYWSGLLKLKTKLIVMNHTIWSL